MYVNSINRWEDEPEIISFIQKNAFATLITQVNRRSLATHLPFVLDQNEPGKAIISGHIAKANAQWKSLPDQSEVLVIFQGPHAYISSSWYNHENVPTWNYLSVHVYGKIKIIEGEELLAHLKKLVDTYEEGRPNRVSVEGMSEAYLQGQIRALVGFEIQITEVQASAKLSQNRDQTNFENIITELSKGNFDLDQKVAKEMRRFQEKKSKS
jgi:transcriptional regulator